jgi:hypothetical protein
MALEQRGGVCRRGASAKAVASRDDDVMDMKEEAGGSGGAGEFWCRTDPTIGRGCIDT